jgi:pyocin large subunit-like protein
LVRARARIKHREKRQKRRPESKSAQRWRNRGERSLEERTIHGYIRVVSDGVNDEAQDIRRGG